MMPIYLMDNRFEDFSKMEFIPLTDQIIVNHLSGKEIISVDPFFSDNISCFMAVDFNAKNWIEPIKIKL